LIEDLADCNSAIVAVSLLTIIIDPRLLGSKPPKCLALGTNWWGRVHQEIVFVLSAKIQTVEIYDAVVQVTLPTEFHQSLTAILHSINCVSENILTGGRFLRVRKWNRSVGRSDILAAFDRSLMPSTIDLRAIHS
jgi:hypothetical protein